MLSAITRRLYIANHELFSYVSIYAFRSEGSDGFVLIPIDKTESDAWIDVLCNSIHGAQLKSTNLFPAANLLCLENNFSSNDSNRSYYAQDNGVGVSEISLTGNNEDSSARDDDVSTPRRRKSRRSSTSRRQSATASSPSATTSELMDHSNAVLREAQEMMLLAQQFSDDATTQELKINGDGLDEVGVTGAQPASDEAIA